MSSDRNAVKKGVSHFPPENARAVNCIKAPVYTIQKVTCESEAGVNRPGFPGECFICELRLP
uniref:hypothetical protein n=1 Tax=Escherichia coli TaxID=562 RepID=UPI001CDAAA2A